HQRPWMLCAKARRHSDPEICERAFLYFLPQGNADGELEEYVARAVRLGAIELAEHCRVLPVTQALLELALSAEPTVRVNAAALLMYVCGHAEEPFECASGHSSVGSATTTLVPSNLLGRSCGGGPDYDWSPPDDRLGA